MNLVFWNFSLFFLFFWDLLKIFSLMVRVWEMLDIMIYKYFFCLSVCGFWFKSGVRYLVGV